MQVEYEMWSKMEAGAELRILKICGPSFLQFHELFDM